MLKGVIEESTTYQWILKQGAIRQSRKLLLRLGRDQLGEPDAASVARVEATENLDELERLCERTSHVNTWQELFAG